MAASLVGGAFLSGFLNVVFERLASPEVANLIRGKKLDHKLLRRLETTLYAVEAVLNDAEHRQIKEPAVKKWLDELKDAVYVADDLLDQVSTKAVTQKEVSSLFSRLFNLQDREMVKNLEDIVDRLESILKLKDSLGLKEIARENFSWRISSSLEDGSRIYGRDKDKEAIFKLLLDGDKGDGKVSVIPIVGMGGVGKTTLAQSVYNNDILKQQFDFKAWVCVSEEFDILKVTKNILEAVTGSTCNMNDINLLHLDLKDKLSGKKFLIVLDDVWMEDYVNWNFLKKPFQYGSKGSKILVTTRSEKVASVVQTFQAYYLNHLSDDDCWLVFVNHACLSSESSDNTALEKIGKKIVKKCKGLPLAAQTLGGLMRTKRDIKDWDNILNSDIWELSENESKIIPALRISYHYLPPQLKRCFVYCSLYPKDYEFDKDELILLWMAEDLLQPLKKGKFFEEVGSEYFDDLASRSFFQRSSTKGKSFVMHDLMHDLATSLGGEFYFRSEELGKETKIGIKARHLSFSRFSDPILENFEVFGSVKFLRTFLPLNFTAAPFNNEKAPCIILSKFKYLRVLSFRYFPNLVALPDSIGELIHLRYLDLSWTSIETLPESLGNLYNLQTLKLCRFDKLTMLPSGMQNLVNLRHLDFPAAALKEMPRGMGKLNHLQHLSGFIVGKHEENGIKELGELSNLHGSLSIRKLENVTNSSEALEARLRDKKRLNSLFLEWSSGDDFTDSQIEMDILGKLQPHQDLKSLSIKGYRGTRFPDWVGHSSYRTMTKISLYGCENCWMLPSLGQLPSLKCLTIEDFNALHTIDADFYKNGDSFSLSVTSFPSLKYLEFRRMPCWEEWRSFESDAFPQLKELIISGCPRLRGDLPNHLPALEALEIGSCEQLASSLPRAPAIRRIDISGSNRVVLQELPLSVEHLTIGGGSQVVESITNTQPTCPQNLYSRGCSSAASFPGGCLPASLKALHIENFRKLEFPKQHRHELLESLTVRCSCDSLTSLPLDTFPNLYYLGIKSCENLESLSVSQSQDDAALQNLSRFEMEGCPNFVSFPREGLRAPSLTYFKVQKCNKLKSLPPQMNTLLPKLEYLRIGECPEIESFPEGGMPPNLTTMSIFNCEKLLSGLGLGLASMDMLTRLAICGRCESVKSFPKEGLLPPSLKSLVLRGLSNLETLECKGLLHLTSLQQLIIHSCPKLGNMTGERLPASLIKLQIYESPLLEERCQTKHPQIWPKISHIRGIYMKGRWIS